MFSSMFGGKRRRSRRRRSRRRRRSGGNLVKCMAKCRNDAVKSGSAANDMKKAMKGVAAKPLAQKMSALNKYKAAAEKQKKVASAGLEDAKKAIDIGASAIMISNHGGRQLDGSRAPFDQLSEIVDAVGDKVEVILDGGVRRGTHVLKALSLGAKACSFGKGYLYALAAGGQRAIEIILEKMQSEIKRDMILMGCKSVKDLNKLKVIFRKD